MSNPVYKTIDSRKLLPPMSNLGLGELRSQNQESSSSSSGIINRKDQPFLPDDIIMDIVSRLPSIDAFRFQSICKRAKGLMSSRDFIESQNKHSVPLILVFSDGYTYCPDLSILARWSGSECRKSKVQKIYSFYPDHILHLSQDGLIVSKNRKNPGIFIVFNPIYSHVVKITVQDSLIQQQQCEIYGVFYQHSIKEYCTLWAFTVSVKWEPVKVQYKMLNLGSEPKWRDITNPWTQNGRKQNIRPVLVNGYLYWVPEPELYNKIVINVDILEFDTINEVFEVIPLPYAAIEGYSKSEVNLLQANGLLLLVQATHMSSPSPIDIWTLESRSNKTWTHITVNVKSNRLTCVDYKVVAFWHDELLLHSGSTSSELYVCNPKLGREMNFGKVFGTRSFVPHVMSLASLENCKSDICMVEEEGKKNPEK